MSTFEDNIKDIIEKVEHMGQEIERVNERVEDLDYDSQKASHRLDTTEYSLTNVKILSERIDELTSEQPPSKLGGI